MIELLLAVVIGVLYGTGVYMLLRRNLLKFIIALGLLSNGTHLLIFTGAGLTRGAPPLIGTTDKTLQAPFADPLPQALILTAIVISFALTAFSAILIHRAHRATGTDDPEALTETDRLEPYQAPERPLPNLPGLQAEEADAPRADASPGAPAARTERDEVIA